MHFLNLGVTFTPKSDQSKFPLQAQQQYYITQYEELGYS